MSHKGLVIVYYGDGKGKTTAAMGLAVRAIGSGLRVHVIQFMKGTWTTGEMESLQKLGAGFEQMGKGFFKIMNDQLTPEEHVKAARGGLERAIEFISQSTVNSQQSTKREKVKVDVLILDEILRAVQEGLLSKEDVHHLIEQKPFELHLVMTGHTVWPRLIELADLVTEMKKMKHPFDSGILAQAGIDF